MIRRKKVVWISLFVLHFESSTHPSSPLNTDFQSHTLNPFLSLGNNPITATRDEKIESKQFKLFPTSISSKNLNSRIVLYFCLFAYRFFSNVVLLVFKKWKYCNHRNHTIRWALNSFDSFPGFSRENGKYSRCNSTLSALVAF